MPMSLTLTSNGTGADASTVNIPFGQVQTAYNNHVAGLADLHDSSQISDSSLSEVTTITNAASTTHARLDMIFAMISGIIGGTGLATARYAAIPTNLTALNTALNGATAAATPLTIPKRDGSGGTAFAGTVTFASLTATPLAGNAAGILRNQVGNTGVTFATQTANGITNEFVISAGGVVATPGTLTLGSGPTTVSDSVGKILSAALNTVGAAQGGTGVASPSAGYVKSAGGTSAMTTVTLIPVVDGGTGVSSPTAGYMKAAGGTAAMTSVATIPVGDGGTGQTTYTNGQLLIGNTTGNTLAKGTITASGGIVVTNGSGTIALSTSGLAASGANSDITSLSALSTALSVAQGGTGKATTATGALLVGAGASAMTELVGTVVGQSVVWSGSAWVAGTPGSVALSAITSPGTVGNLFYSDGTHVVSAAASVAISDASVPMSKMLEGAILQEGSGTLRVYVNPLKKWNSLNTPIHWDGGYLDLTALVPGSGNNRYVLIAINGTAVAYAKGGNPTSGALTDADRPTQDPNTTPLAFVTLSFGQTTITAANIQPWRGPYDGSTASGGGSQIGHIQGQSGESLVTSIGLGEGFPHPTATASLSFLVDAMHYRNTAGIVVLKGQTTVGPIANPASGLRIIPVYLDPATGSYVLGTSSDDPSAPATPAFSGNQIGVCYIHTRSTATVVKAGDDGTNAWIEDARTWTRGGIGVSSVPVAVSEGGTGIITGGGGGLALLPSGTTPAVIVPALTSVTRGLSVNPTVTPAGVDAEMFTLGGGTVATGTTAITNVRGVHVSANTKTGTGVITTAEGVRIDGPTIAATTSRGLFITMPTGATTNVGIGFDTPAGAIAQEAWTAPTLLNSWVNFGSSFSVAQYMKDTQGFVHIGGTIKSGTIGAIAFTAAVGYRSATVREYGTYANAAFGIIQVDTGGGVTPNLGSNVIFSLDGPVFATN